MTSLSGRTVAPAAGESVRPLGWWRPDTSSTQSTDAAACRSLLGDLDQTVFVLRTPDGVALATGGGALIVPTKPGLDYSEVAAILPPLPPTQLGDAAFRAAHGLRFAYMTGAMANGIGSVEIVTAMSRAGMLGSFGAAGLSVERVTQAIDRLQAELGDAPFCVNLIHSPNEPTHEAAIADLLLRKHVRLVEASAYLDLSPAIVRYRVSGLEAGPDGSVTCRNRVIAKVSRVEVATRFLSPPPAKFVNELLQSGVITAEQAELAKRVPMCDDLTAEADSGGHTDNRPAITLLPTMLALRDRLQHQFQFSHPVRVGLAGGIATPAGVAGAFALGASYVVTGSVNQACVESGSSDLVRTMLAEAGQADVTMAPAADMFEMGVKVQVLKRGTMFAMRGQKLFDAYRAYPNWEAIPANDRVQFEKTMFRKTFDEIWTETRDFFSRRDPSQLAKAEADPRHRMALVFRWYLGLSSRWANAGEPTRQLDYQVWCGPAMGAFNEWTKGSELERPANRTVTAVARNLLYGAAVHARVQSSRQAGAELPAEMVSTGPWNADELEKWFA
jgi:trans-AT polyketide synthase/acyltransferase/oxidoreductase domain-containing protein